MSDIRTRQEIPENDCWDLTPLFSSDKDWESLYKNLEGRISGYEDFRGRLSESFDAFKACLDFDTA
ncbi:MAG: oligoendopeptidase F, partial [Proteobacteria bacterium]|nr:oligoendopeptidase F [Pseudomonadota bacterium]